MTESFKYSKSPKSYIKLIELSEVKIMRKKGDLSMNVIIAAALALLVLVILSVVFVGKMSKTRQEIDSCAANGGRCLNPGECGVNPDGSNDPYKRETRHECMDLRGKPTGDVCCMGV